MGADNLRVAVAGCHRMLLRDLANHNFAAAFDAVADTDIVAVCDYGVETRAEFAECWRPVWAMASRKASSFASLPELRKKQVSSGSGSVATSRSA